jgi:hypothetical protein
MGDFLADGGEGLDQIGTRRELVFDAVDIDGYKGGFSVRDHVAGKVVKP